MIGAGTYVLTVALLAAVIVPVGFSAVRVRRRLLPEWEGAPAHLVETILAVTLLILLAELLGTAQILYSWALVAASVMLGGWRIRLDRPGSAEGGSPRVAAGGGARTSRPADPPAV